MRKPLILVALAGAVIAAVFLLLQSDSDRADGRRDAVDRAGAGAAAAAAEDGGGGGADLADPERLAALIERHGGVVATGRVMLTGPEAPGAGLEVVLRATLDGDAVAGRATTDALGKFAFAPLPRTLGYTVSVESERTQPFSRGDLDLQAATVDLGDLAVDRWYFVGGRVTAAGARAVEGAEVFLVQPNAGGFSVMRSTQNAAQPDERAAETRSGADGAYRMRLAAPGMYTLGVRADGWAPHHRPNVYVAAADAEVNVSLTRGFDIFGTVLDGAGRPLPAVPVSLWAMSRRSWNPAKELTKTDAAGQFRFRVEPAANSYVLTAVPRGGLNLNKSVRVPLEEELILQQPGQGALTGRVIDARTQQPVVGAEVLVSMSTGRARGWIPDYSKPLVTDAYGVYRVEGVGPGRLASIAVQADGYAPLMGSRNWPQGGTAWQAVAGVEISGNGETRLPDLALEPGKVLTGVVRDKETNAPLAGASVEIFDFMMGNRGVVTDATGRYVLSGLGDRVAMVVSADGYASFRDPMWPGFSLQGDLRERTRDLELEAGGTISGEVRGAGGAPLAGALVRLESAETGRGAWMSAFALRDVWTHSGPDGAYTLTGVPPLRLRVTATATGYDMGRTKDKKIGPGESVTLDLALPPAARMEGRVAGRDDQPVANARVTVARDPGPDASPTDRWRALAAGVDAFTDARGRFVVADVPTGAVLVRVEADGFATLTDRRADVQPGAELAGVRLELAPAFAITGRVVDARGQPYPNCWVRARQTVSPDGEPSPQLLGTGVAQDGTFTIRNLPAGTYEVEVRVRNWGNDVRYANLTVPGVAAGARDLELRLRPAPPDEE